MKRIVTETPDKWVILKIKNDLCKVFGTWTGGYLDGDRWKLNSGITKVEQDEDFYYFTGFSGSVYKCHKKMYGVVGTYGRIVLHDIVNETQAEIFEDKEDWATTLNNTPLEQ